MKARVLLGIIGRISEYSGIKSTQNPITALDNDAMRVGLHKFVVEKYLPLGVKYLAAAVRHKGFTGPNASQIFSCKVFK